MVHVPTGAATNNFTTFCGLTPVERETWERVYDDLVLAMLFLNNSRNEQAKKNYVTRMPMEIPVLTRLNWRRWHVYYLPNIP